MTENRVSKGNLNQIILSFLKHRAPFTSKNGCCKSSKTDKVYTTGQNRFLKEFDIIEVLKATRLSKLITNHKQRILLQMQRNSVISDEEIQEQTPLTSVFELGKLNSYADEDADELTCFDKRLFEGLY